MSELVDLSVVPSGPCDLDFAWYEEIREDFLRRTVGRAEQVLDVGCGPGDILLMLAEQIGEGIGIDICDDDLRRAERARKELKITNVTFRHADATALPFPDGNFDIVLLLGDVLCYPNLYGKHDLVVAELKRVLKEGGTAVHQSINWEWEYRWPYPPSDMSFTRSGEGGFTLARIRRTASGLETCRNYEVLPATPLYQWILEQEWPVSPQGLNTSLEAREGTPIPKKWLKFKDVSRHKHYRPQDLQRLYKRAGFRHVEVLAYGQTYDIVTKAGLLQEISAFQSQLAAIEAELAYTLRLGSGPWLFLVAEK